ncbi:hypothetical protein LB505_006382 [Fusarium chuoi]|nr:hypothetical protein LB505_006382 [Fusarium chuoi]
MTHAARAAAAASKNASRSSSSSSSTASSALSPPSSGSGAPEAHPNKRQKRSHSDDIAIEQTPPPSPTPGSSLDLDTNHSANPCAIISSRLASYAKRQCWSDTKPCPLAKELESVHPRRTYYFLTTCPRQPIPEPNSTVSAHAALETPSVSLTDDSGSDDDARRRELSPSPEVDLSDHGFEEGDDDVIMPLTPIGSLPSHHRYVPNRRNSRHNSPPLEKDEREFTQTADFLQKRKFTEDIPVAESADRTTHTSEYGYRDDFWFGDHRIFTSNALLTSPAVKPSSMSNTASSLRKEDDGESWLKFSKLMEWDRGAESIEIDELDCLLDTC